MGVDRVEISTKFFKTTHGKTKVHGVLAISLAYQTDHTRSQTGTVLIFALIIINNIKARSTLDI